MSRKFSRQFNSPLGFPAFIASKIVIQIEQPPDALLEEDVVEIKAEVTRSLAERYDMEFERLGGYRWHIHLLCSADPKIVPWQMVRMFKSFTGPEVFRGKPAFKKELRWGEFWSYGYYGGTVREGGNCRVVQQYVQELGKLREELPQLTLSNITWFGHGDLYSRKSHSLWSGNTLSGNGGMYCSSRASPKR